MGALPLAVAGPADVARPPDVARPRATVIGLGLVGSIAAWRLHRAGFAVTGYDADPDRAAARVAAGMLAPLGEAEPGERAALELGERSLRAWPALAAELAADAGMPTDALIAARDTIALGFDGADAAELDRVAALRDPGLGDSRPRPLGSAELRELVPGLTSRARAARLYPGEWAVDNRAVFAGLRAATPGLRVVREDLPSTQIGSGPIGSGPIGSALLGEADLVVIAVGAAGPDVVAVRGEILRLRAPADSLAPPAVTIRARVRGRQLYLVPRPGRRLVVGASSSEDAEPLPRVGGVLDLLDDAATVFPPVRDYVIEEIGVGYRPVSADGLPHSTWLDDGTVSIGGHGRNGFLWAPWTVDAVEAAIARIRPTRPAAALTNGLPQ